MERDRVTRQHEGLAALLNAGEDIIPLPERGEDRVVPDPVLKLPMFQDSCFCPYSWLDATELVLQFYIACEPGLFLDQL